jgi:hypothetical protein
MDAPTLVALAVALKSSTAVADPSAPRDNPHALPSGKPIAALMRKTFRRMAKEIRAWLETQPPGAIPASPPDLTHHAKPLAKALATLTLPYREEAGTSILEGLGLESDWSPDPKANDDRAAFAAESIVQTTQDELRAALDALRGEIDAKSGGSIGATASGVGANPGGAGPLAEVPAGHPGVDGMGPSGSAQGGRHGGDRQAARPVNAKGLGALLSRAWDALKGVFRRGEEVRADAIAELEASEAVHAASVEAVAVATSNQAVRPRKRWLVDGAPCEEICIPNMRAGLIPLAATFPGGQSWPPAHPNCKCSIAVEDVKVGPRRIRKR